MDHLKSSEAIKQMRIDKGLTQKQFGALVGCTLGMVSKWEQGHGISPERLRELAAALGNTITVVYRIEPVGPNGLG